MADTAFGANLGRLRCRECGEGYPRYPAGLCGDCYRARSGYQPEPVVLVTAPPPPKPPKPPRKRKPAKPPNYQTRYRRRTLGCGPMDEATVNQLWALREPVTPRPRPVGDRGCAWPGCERPHYMHGFCSRDDRRVTAMGLDPRTVDASELPALWDDRRAVVHSAERRRKGAA